MYRCPRCTVELAPDARFCPSCGFNQTNARMQKAASPQAAQSKAPVTPTPVTPTPSINPATPTDIPPTPLTPQPLSARSFQPEVKRVIPRRPSLNEQTAPLASPPPIEPALSIRQQMSPIQPENVQQQENKNTVLPNTVRPVRTNTPPRPGKGMPVPPTAPSRQETPQQAQPSDMPAHLITLAAEERRHEQAYQAHPPQTDQAAAPVDQAHPYTHVGERPEGTKVEDGQGQAGETNVPGFSLTKRYMAEQETRHQPSFPVNNLADIPLEESPTRPLQSVDKVWNKKDAALQRLELQRGFAEISTMVHPSEASPIFDPFTGEGAESLIATSKAAEHWRQSWRDRQRAEAGPAVGITRGQADVPEPLLMMQNSIARMRAIIIPKNTTASRSKNFGFWFTLILLLCIIGGMCAYVISTYASSTQLATQISGAGNNSPTLTLQGSHTNTITAGQTLQVHGAYFGANHAITFILATTPLSSAPVQSNNNGMFNASLTIPATWLTGNYALQAQDNQSGLHAFLDLQILPGTVAMSNNTPLVLTMNGLPLPTTGLSFKTVMGKDNATGQRITLTNSGSTPVQWSASAIADNNLTWLMINDGKTSGTLASNGTDSIGISVSSIGLPNSTKPYRGSFILTVNQTQAIVPVSLTVQDTSLEVVVNPNPVIAYLQAGGTCQPVTLTLINLSGQIVTWNANPYDADKPHIHLDGQTTDQGTLDPEGLPNDTKVIQITCIGAQTGEKLYHISVYYNGVAVNVPVTTRYA